jgi:lysophospholipase L1-like esterase
MSAMIDLAHEHGVPVLLLAFPSSKPDLTAYLAVLEQIRRERGIPLLTYEGPRFDPVHPTVEGYQKLAGELLARLELERYVGRQPGAIQEGRIRSNWRVRSSRA